MQITHAPNNFFFMIWKISPPLDRKGHATMFTEHLIIILKIIKYFFSASLNEEFVTDHFSFAYFFSSFTSIACVTCFFESHSYNKEKYARKWPLDCTRHQKFFFSRCVWSCYLYLVKTHWLLCEVIFLATLWKRNYIVLWSCILPYTI